ncbi:MULTISPECIES: DEAD/DEAH box helicase [unclassified Dehalobacter]|uniref:DEAD/DEAH box helicase n=1 Tax=unclassified Dehalobacter TaxID=2635733 RepID=UPI000E6BC0E5|nr:MULTISPECIES: DEAD/DEAH box helicase [unclassified Dehalobacter]RJE47194.1 helicase II [Dehalobacter sp. MCB1]TCX53560.1 helicase II [Dehalobacter sp. 14DCB1]TCX54945.1 helicase II [Dehalobacter sp. 12DCB1]
MSESFKFVTPKKIKIIEKDPESIFHELQIPSVKGLWSQQADILRDYYSNNRDKENIALELPTGTGKTLVGLLIAEYRRRCKENRVLYLCPTRQLANQVFIKAKEYGISACLLIGPQAHYSESDYGNYLRGRAIAITTYSAIFNTNPRLDDANTIIFDDAHSAENYISSLWTLNIKRKDNKNLFENIIKLFEDDISDYHYNRIMHDDYDHYIPIYDLIPYPKFLFKKVDLISLIEANVEDCGNAKYAWSMICNNIEACQMFFSWGEINIRPLIPPTLTHYAFKNASQRVFMSATLGDGGELERITGIRELKKIPIPKGWEKYSNGRRLILFPNLKFTSNQAILIAINAISKQKKALVLCPDNSRAQVFKDLVNAALPEYQILESRDIEDSLETFLHNEKVVLILTNRYDGIDLSGDICRLLIIFGMPQATNLQEGFLWNRLGANSILNELVKTRITQALGRCTRSSDDFANVLMIDPDLVKFCAKKENIEAFHSEIQAEIEFGLTNSEKMDSAEQMVDFMYNFINNKEYFSAINDAINGIRDEYDKVVRKETIKLTSSVSNEVDFTYALWKNELERALEKAKAIIDSLSGGKEIAGYRAWWFYLAGNCAYLANGKINIDERLAREYYTSALSISSAMTWLTNLVSHVPTKDDLLKSDRYLAIQAENIENIVSELGILGVKFEKQMTEFLESLNNDDAKIFEKGLELLGKYLGFDSTKPKGDGTPDGIWQLDNIIYGFEAKTEEKKDAPISIDNCRQASGHINWIKEKRDIKSDTQITVIIISPKDKIHEDAIPQSRDLFHKNVEEIRLLGSLTTQLLRKIRSLLVKDHGSTLFSREQICLILTEERLSYQDIGQKLTDNPLSEIKASK